MSRAVSVSPWVKGPFSALTAQTECPSLALAYHVALGKQPPLLFLCSSFTFSICSQQPCLCALEYCTGMRQYLCGAGIALGLSLLCHIDKKILLLAADLFLLSWPFGIC